MTADSWVTRRDAFVGAIAAAPMDPSHPAAYAAWLEETGDALLAALMRAESQRLTPGLPLEAYRSAVERKWDLLRQHGAARAAAIPSTTAPAGLAWREPRWERDRPSVMLAAIDDCLAHAAELAWLTTLTPRFYVACVDGIDLEVAADARHVLATRATTTEPSDADPAQYLDKTFTVWDVATRTVVLVRDASATIVNGDYVGIRTAHFTPDSRSLSIEWDRTRPELVALPGRD